MPISFALRTLLGSAAGIRHSQKSKNEKHVGYFVITGTILSALLEIII